MLISCSVPQQKEINLEELKKIEQENPIFLHKINALQGEFLISYVNPFTYQLILVHETDYLYKTYYNRFVKYKEVQKFKKGTSYKNVVQKLGIPIIIKDNDEKKIAYFQRGFSFTKGFYLYSYIIILSFKNDLLESCKEEYFFRP
jgi:hypothetical protein